MAVARRSTTNLREMPGWARMISRFPKTGPAPVATQNRLSLPRVPGVRPEAHRQRKSERPLSFREGMGTHPHEKRTRFRDEEGHRPFRNRSYLGRPARSGPRSAWPATARRHGSLLIHARGIDSLGQRNRNGAGGAWRDGQIDANSISNWDPRAPAGSRATTGRALRQPIAKPRGSNPLWRDRYKKASNPWD